MAWSVRLMHIEQLYKTPFSWCEMDLVELIWTFYMSYWHQKFMVNTLQLQWEQACPQTHLKLEMELQSGPSGSDQEPMKLSITQQLLWHQQFPKMLLPEVIFYLLIQLGPSFQVMAQTGPLPFESMQSSFSSSQEKEPLATWDFFKLFQDRKKTYIHS